MADGKRCPKCGNEVLRSPWSQEYRCVKVDCGFRVPADHFDPPSHMLVYVKNPVSGMRHTEVILRINFDPEKHSPFSEG